MATWVVGDVQGCKKPLKRLLKKVGFSWEHDELWATGDLINRGPRCLKTLRWFYKHREQVRMVLGNHDLHLMAVAAGVRKPSRSDTLGEILAAPDRSELIRWLHEQPLMIQEGDVVLTHAGIPPIWTIDEALDLAAEVETVLQSGDCLAFFEKMYGNTPDVWSDDLEGVTRLRTITNYFTRMRYCYADGRLDLVSKGSPGAIGSPNASEGGPDAWFRHPRPDAGSERIIFGHWASLQGVTGDPLRIALDTGCVWGNAMTLYCLETGERVLESCHGCL